MKNFVFNHLKENQKYHNIFYKVYDLKSGKLLISFYLYYFMRVEIYGRYWYYIALDLLHVDQS